MKIPGRVWTAIAVAMAIMLVAGYVLMRGIFRVVDTGKVAEGPLGTAVYAVRDSFANLYVITDGRTTFCIDAGTDRKSLAGEFAKIGIDPASVSRVYFTHSDRDHVAGAPLFSRAVFYIPSLEVPLADGKEARVFFWNKRKQEVPVNYVPVKEGTAARAGSFTVLPISTPGHTPGSASYLINGKWLFTGDLLRLKDGQAVPMPGGFNMDTARAAGSIRELGKRTRGVQLLLTAHTGVTADVAGAFVEPAAK